jgi:serine/threonine-protein kinase
MIRTFACHYCNAALQADQVAGIDQVQCAACQEMVFIPAAFAEGDTIGGYVITGKLGAGGMGEVFKAEHPTLQRSVALKILAPGMTRQADAVARFLQEARMAARVEHPNIVAALDAGEDDGCCYFAMSLVDGDDLDDLLARDGRVHAETAIDVAIAVAHALKFAWDEHRILHRDIKPGNIMIDRSGHVRLLDMGLATSLQEESTLTREGMVLGTPHYMSPEQATQGRNIDCRADIYSLGATLYHVVTGSLPYEGGSVVNILAQLIRDPAEPPHMRLPGLSRGLSDLIMAMMAKDASQRPQDWAALLADLDRVKANRAPRHAPVLTPGIVPETLQLAIQMSYGGSKRQQLEATSREQAAAEAARAEAEAAAQAAAAAEEAAAEPERAAAAEPEPARQQPSPDAERSRDEDSRRRERPTTLPLVPLLVALVVAAGLGAAAAVWLLR